MSRNVQTKRLVLWITLIGGGLWLLSKSSIAQASSDGIIRGTSASNNGSASLANASAYNYSMGYHTFAQPTTPPRLSPFPENVNVIGL